MVEKQEEILLEAKNLEKHFMVKNFFGTHKQTIKAVDGVSLCIHKKETFGLVGESGCGKSTLGRTLIRMYEPTGGKIIFDGSNITALKAKELLPYHKRMQIIFQDPYSALDPHHNVREILSEPILAGIRLQKSQIGDKIAEC